MATSENDPINKLLDAVEFTPLNHTPPTDGSNYATHEGVLQIGEISITVYVINTGERIIPAAEMDKIFGAGWETIPGIKK